MLIVSEFGKKIRVAIISKDSSELIVEKSAKGTNLTLPLMII
jgi:hypothetical protein